MRLLLKVSCSLAMMAGLLGSTPVRSHETTQTTAGDATAPVEAQPRVLKRPLFRRLPTENDMAHRYPGPAFQKGIDGLVKLGCLVDPQGRLTACQVLEETPSDMGFGEATKSLAEIFRLGPISKDGEQTAGMTYIFKVTWRLPRT